MSINGAMLAGISGLSANASALSSISQNIANVNTVGYKRMSTEFATVVNNHAYGTSAVTGGVQASARHYISQTGLLKPTASNTDLAIAGQGFFVVTDKSENVAANDTRLFTRAGAFTVDRNGYLQNTAGLYLQGWPANSEGEILTDPSNMNLLKTINVGSVGGAAERTTRVGLNANLNAGLAVSVPAILDPAHADYNAARAYDPTSEDTSMAAFYAATPAERETMTKPDFEINIPISDSLGGQKTITLALLKSSEANVWHAELIADGNNFAGNTADLPNQIRSGKIAFTTDGRLDVDRMKAWAQNGLETPIFADPENASIEIGGSEDAAGPDGRWLASEGIKEQTIAFDLNAAAGGLTQYESASVVQATFTNGTTFGNLTEVKIDDKGYVTAIFDNGVMRQIAQVAIATFPSAENLTEVSGNAYRVSQYSGTFNLKVPGEGGAGLLASSQLESSTVDLAAEFTGLITTQRAYSASSKIITTADEMLAELINIKR